MIHLDETKRPSHGATARRISPSAILWTIVALPVLPGALFLMGVTLLVARGVESLDRDAASAPLTIGTETLA